MQRFYTQCISAALLACCSISAYAQEIKGGSVIQLVNRTPVGGVDRYLEVNANVQSVAGFTDPQWAQASFVFANSSKERDRLASQWKVIHAVKSDGEALAYGDIIKLKSMTPSGAFLTVADVNMGMRETIFSSKELRAAGLDPKQENIFHFAFAQVTDATWAGEWLVGSGGADSKAMIEQKAKVKVGDAILLEPVSVGQGRVSAFTDAKLVLYLLQTPFATAQMSKFAGFQNRDMVFSTRLDSRVIPQQMKWFVNVATTAGSTPQTTTAVPAPQRTSAGPVAQSDGFPLRGAITLNQGRKYFSESGKHYLVFQPDGNLVVYTSGNQFVWGLNTITPKFNEAKLAEFQAEGNLAVYGANRAYIWSALTGRRAPDTSSYLTLTPEGVLRLMSGNGAVMWSSR